MVLAYFRIRYTKSRMVAYVNGELPQAARRRIARYIEQYPACYAEYVKQREAVRELQFRLPLVGQPEDATLNRMWAAIQSEITPTATQRRRQSGNALINFRVRYGVVGLALALAFILPMTFSGSRSVFAVSLSQPIPLTATSESVTQVAEDKSIRMLISSTSEVESTPPPPALPRATAVSTDE